MNNVFINRKEELSKLCFGLKRGNNYIVIAPRRYGKTRLIQKVLKEVGKEKGFVTFDLDIMCYSGGSIKSIAEGIIEKCLGMLGIRGKLRQLIRQTDFQLSLKLKYNELEVEPIIKLFDTKEPENEWKLLEHSLELIEKVAKWNKKRVVVFFDEFGELAALGERAIKIFRSVIQKQEVCSYIFAGSQETVMSNIFIDKAGAFYRFGELIYLDVLSNEDVFIYLQENFPEVSTEVIGLNLEILRGHPYYTGLIVEHLSYNSKLGKTPEAFVSYIYNELLENERAYLELQVLQIKEKANALEVIRLIALGLNPYSEINHIKRSNIGNVLRGLEVGGFIRRRGVGNYVITDPLLEIFLKNN